MYVNGEALAARLRMVGQQLDSAAGSLAAAVDIDAGYRFRPWGMRGKVHAHVDAARAQLQLARSELGQVDGGFTAALDAVSNLVGRASADALDNLGPARNPAAYRRSSMRDMQRAAASWAEVMRDGARLVEDPAASRDAHRSIALDLAARITREPRNIPAADLRRLAALDELPAALRPDLPFPVARQAANAAGQSDAYLGDTLTSLSSWARRERMLERPGFDRAAAVDELARALDGEDPQEALRTVAAIDQLPGHVRPDLPHVAGDWNWTEAQKYRNPGTHATYVEALRGRLDDLRASVDVAEAPGETLTAVRSALATGGDDGLVALRGLPGFPPSLVAEGVPPSSFDRVRIRVWLDAQDLARRPGVTKQDMVDEIHAALDALEQPSTVPAAGGSGSGAMLADRLERTARHSVPNTLSDQHAALVRIAAIDTLPESLRPDLPGLGGIGSRIDAAAHQSPRAFDHAKDLLRLRAWAAQQPRMRFPAPEVEEVERSALRRFLDPHDAADAADALTRAEQADLLVGVLSNAGSYRPRELHGALVAAQRHLAGAEVVDDQLRSLVDQAREIVDRNIRYTEGRNNPGYATHPDYAELGRVGQAIKLADAFDRFAAAQAGTLTW